MKLCYNVIALSSITQIKIVAEDSSTLEFVKENISKKFSLPPGEEVFFFYIS